MILSKSSTRILLSSSTPGDVHQNFPINRIAAQDYFSGLYSTLQSSPAGISPQPSPRIAASLDSAPAALPPSPRMVAVRRVHAPVGSPVVIRSPGCLPHDARFVAASPASSTASREAEHEHDDEVIDVEQEARSTVAVVTSADARGTVTTIVTSVVPPTQL
jgi:hypothetical protein